MSSLADALAERARNRPLLSVPLSGFLVAPAPDGAIMVRGLSIAEHDEATHAAASYRKATLATLPEKYVREFLEDPTFLDDAKQVERMWRACRDAVDKTKPAFPSAQWMRDNLTREELAKLYGWFEKASALAAGAEVEFTQEQILGLADVASIPGGGDYLMSLTKPALCVAFVRLSLEYQAVRNAQQQRAS